MRKKLLKDIPEYEGRYAITRNGEVWSYPKIQKFGCKNTATINSGNCWLKPTFSTKKGQYRYLKVNLLKNGKRKCLFIHRLVALTFLPIPNRKKQINHKNGIRDDNRVSNLEWVTAQQNIAHAFKKGLIQRKSPSSAKQG